MMRGLRGLFGLGYAALVVVCSTTHAAPSPAVTAATKDLGRQVASAAETIDAMVTAGKRSADGDPRAVVTSVARSLDELRRLTSGQNDPAISVSIAAATRAVQLLQEASSDVAGADLARATTAQRDAMHRRLHTVVTAATELQTASAPVVVDPAPDPVAGAAGWTEIARGMAIAPVALPIAAAFGCLLLLAAFGVTPRRMMSRLRSRRPGDAPAARRPAVQVIGETDDSAHAMQQLAASFFSPDAQGAGDRDLTTAVMGAIGDALIIVDCDGIIRTVNQATCDLLEYDKSDLVGREVDGIVLADDERTPEWRTEHVLRDVTVRYLTRDRRVLPMSLSMAPVRDARGNLLGTIGVARDMRDRIRLTAEVEQARDAALELSRIKSEFLANMSHEIRTPMNAIIGYTDIALETEITPVQRGYLDAVRRAAVALLGIINEVLDFSRIEAGKLSLEKLPFSLRDVLRETLRTLAVRADEKGLDLGWEIDANVPDGVVGDSNRLRQVLVNLINNGIKFTDKGQVVVSVRVDGAPANDSVMLHFAVADSGIGIPADKLELIFNPFTQADGSMSRTYGGTGLGLAIATQLVELMGGRMRVESEVGRGSVFHFTIHAGLSGDESRVVSTTVPHLHGVRVLLVEDNPVMQDIEARVLREFGMEVESTTTAEAALTLIDESIRSEQPFALLVTDVMLPDADGFELIEYLLRDPHLRQLPALLLGQATKPGDVARSRGLGVAFVGKPVIPGELLEAVCQTLGVDRAAMEQYGVAPATPLRALVAEDNALNRRMIAILLEQQGHSVVTVANGREAVTAIQQEPFDVLLMDLQMPDLDGFQATAEIRALQEGQPIRTPIIALTGHVLPGDRERCLQAGMDGYLPKPIETDALVMTLARVVPRAGASAPFSFSGLPPSVIDVETLLQRVARNRAAVTEIVTIFREDARTLRTDVESSIEGRDADRLERAAARFVASFRAIAAPSAAAAAADLQEKAHQRDFHRAREVWADLVGELDRLEPALVTLLESNDYR